MRSGFDEMRMRWAWMFTPRACVEANRLAPQDTIPRRRAGGLHALSLRGAIATQQSRALTPRWIASLARRNDESPSIEMDMRGFGNRRVFGDVAGDAVAEGSAAAAVGNEAELGDARRDVGQL